MFYAVPTAKVIFMVKTSFDVFSLSREQVWTFSVLDDRIYEMRCLFVAVGLNARCIVQAGTTSIFKVIGMTGPSTNQESNPQILLVSAGSPYRGLLRSAGAIEDLFVIKELHQEPPPRITTRYNP